MQCVFRRAPRHSAVRATISSFAMAALLALAGPAAAQTTAPDTLRMSEVVRLVREANPALRGARLRADAAAERVPQAGALPEPMLSLGLMNRPLDGFGTGEGMTADVVQWSQRLPWPGKLSFARERSRYLADAEQLDADEIEARLVARAKSTYADLAFVDRALAVMEETRTLLRGFEEVSSARYAVGEGLQQDVLSAQIAVARMTEDITVARQRRVATGARLNALLGREATAPIPALELPEPDTPLPSPDALLARAETHRPALAAARARLAAAEAGQRAAGRAVYPDLTVTLGYGHRAQFVDLASLMVGVSVPLWAGARQRPMRREMDALQLAAAAAELDLVNETFARLTELRADADRATSLLRLYADAVLPQARSAVESALSAYRAGRVDYATLVDNQLTVNRYEIERIRLTADYHRALAELEALVGSGPGEDQ